MVVQFIKLILYKFNFNFINIGVSLTKEQRRAKLLECKTGEDFHALYELVFGEIVPETLTRNPNEELDMIISAIYENKKIKGVTLPDDYII